MADKENAGPRQRFRDRFLSGDDESRTDELLLELLLTFAIRRKDVKPLAEELIRVFGNFDQVLAASHDDLNKIKGLGQASMILLKAVDFIKSRKKPPETYCPLTNGRDANQMQLFQDPPTGSTPKFSPQNSVTSKPVQTKTQQEPVGQSIIKRENSSGHVKADQESKAKRTILGSVKAPFDKKSIHRKLQVCNNYLLEFDQLARVLNFLLDQKESKRIKRKELYEATGLADRQVGGLVSMGTAMGLIKPTVQVLRKPADTIKDPYVLDFLGIPDSKQLHESRLESAIIDNLQSFLLELGKGFAFVARQKRLQYEDEFFDVDLVFYNCILKCYLLIDLKIGQLTHQDVGQMDSYVRMFDDLFIAGDDNPTIGLILCSEKNEAIARYSVLNDSKQLFASKYKLYLPTEKELEQELKRERRLIEEKQLKK